MPKAPIRRAGRRDTGPGEFVVELDEQTRGLVRQLCDELDGLLDTDSPLLARLFPPPYGDDRERNEGYSALAGPELIESRRTGIETVRRTVDREWLDEDELMAWMRALNDIRLVLGTLLGISDDSDEPEVPDDKVQTLGVYEFLGALLEMTVQALAS